MSAVWSRDGAGADEDLWDDTELIRAYDEAVRSFKKSQGKDGEQADAGRASSGDSDQVGVEKRTKSPDAPGALNAEQPRPKRVKPLAAKKPAAQAQAPAVPVAAEAQAGNASSGAAASDAAAQQAYWQTQYYAQQAAWYPQQAVAPSYFAPSISAPLPPVQDEALNQLLTAWYNAGYQAGRYQALRGAPS